MEPTKASVQTESTQAIQNSKHKSNNILKTILLIVVIIAVAVSSFLIGTQYVKMRTSASILTQTPSTIAPETKTIITSPTNTITTVAEWKTAKFGGIFSYEYPQDWHVAELWQENVSENGIILAIDPKPISTAPRGGPIAAFQIQLLSGNKNPDEIFAKKIQSFNTDNYTDIIKETIDAPIGKLYHFQGKFPLDGMFGGQKTESYYFTFNQNPNDPYNQQVVIASLFLGDNPKYSDMLRHIVLSFKNLTQ